MALAFSSLWLLTAALQAAAPAPPPVVAEPTTRPICRADTGRVTPPVPMSGRLPLLVLFERNPWSMVIAADFPAVAIYEDGQMLLVRGEGRAAQALHGRIEASAASALRDHIAASGFLDAPLRTDCSQATDQTTVQILLRDGTSWKVASAYGMGKDGSCAVAPAPAFVAAYARLQKLDAADAHDFVPEELELMLWDFAHAQAPPLPWPSDVPPPPASVVPEFYGPEDPKTYRQALPATFQAAIERLARELNASDPPRAVRLNGHQWSVDWRWRWPGADIVDRIVRCAHGAEDAFADGE